MHREGGPYICCHFTVLYIILLSTDISNSDNMYMTLKNSMKKMYFMACIFQLSISQTIMYLEI